MLCNDPVLFEKIGNMVKQKRWEVTASSWVELDKNMASEESMARHLLYAKRYFKEKFDLDDDDLTIDYSPDAFGHSAYIPAILHKGNVKYYYHCRGFEGPYAYV